MHTQIDNKNIFIDISPNFLIHSFPSFHQNELTRDLHWIYLIDLFNRFTQKTPPKKNRRMNCQKDYEKYSKDKAKFMQLI